MTTERERVLCISLTQQEWEAFTSRCPQPVEWLRQQILLQIGGQAPVDVTSVRADRIDSAFASRS